MKFRSLAILAGVAATIVVTADTLVYQTLDRTVRPFYTTGLRTLLLLLVAVAAGLAANRFGWLREYVGRAWTCFFAAYSFLAASEVIRRATGGTTLASQLCVIAGNIAIVIGTALVARSFNAAGLDALTSRTRMVVATAVSLLIALALCYDAIVVNFRATLAGQEMASALVSPLADVITFALIAPLFLSAFALRGGQVFWIFALLTTGTMGWMLNQGWDIMAPAVGLDTEQIIRAGRIAGFAIACVFIAAAAFTQWLAARRAGQAVAIG